MDIVVYSMRCIVMLLVSWVGVRLIGKKSIAEMTSYDLAAIMVLTTVAAEPLVFKIASKATIGVFVILITTVLLGKLSLNKFFYNIDAKPTIIVAQGKIIESELQKVRMNVPLLMSELRIKGYQNISEVEYVIIEPSGKMSVVAKSQYNPLTPNTMDIKTKPVNLSFPLIIDGEIDKVNLKFFQKDEKWLLNQLKSHSVKDISDVLLAQYDSSGKLFINLKNATVKTPNLF